MSTWAGIAPLIGAGSLDGFAIGALASGACFMAITAPRRARKRRAAPAAADYSDALSAARRDWLRDDIIITETDAFPANAERLWLPDTPDVGQPFAPARDNRENRSAAGRHRLGDPIPEPPDKVSGREAMEDGAAPVEAVLSDMPLPAGTSRHTAFPEGVLPGASRGAHRDAVLPDLAFPDGTFGTSRRAESRRLPRHAAPGTTLIGKLSTLMAGLIASRALIGGTHS
jgi:hypothetical protein